MNYCRECGEKVKKGALFCNGCGTPVEQDAKREREYRPKQKVKQTFSKKKIVVISSLFIVCVLLVVLFVVGGNLTSPNKLVAQFEKALNEKDQAAMASLLTSSDSKLKIEEQDVTSLMMFIEEYPEKKSEIMKHLRTQAEVYEETNVQSLPNRKDDFFLNIEQDGGFLFFKNYKISVEAVYITIHTNMKDTVISMNGKEVGKTDKDQDKKTFGPFIPGIYEIEARLKTDVVDLVESKQVVLQQSQQEERVELYAEQVELGLPHWLPASEVTLWVNGKEVQATIPKQGPATFGPVVTDGSMMIAAEATLPWGKVKTKEVALTDTYFSPEFLDESVKNDVMKSAHQYLLEYYAAFTTLNMELLTTTTSTYKTDIQQVAQDHKNSGIITYDKHLSTRFIGNSFEVVQENGQWYLLVTAEITSEHDAENAGVTIQPEVKKRYERIKLLYDGGKWLVSQVFIPTDVEVEEVTEFAVEEPKAFTSVWEQKVTPASSTVNSSKPLTGTMGELSLQYVDERVSAYLNGLIKAINEENFSYVEPILVQGSSLYRDQQALVKKLGNNDTKETLLDYRVTDVTFKDHMSLYITTWEKITIHYRNGTSETKEYEWVYTADFGDDTVLRFSSISKR
ncbi:hypothetical protein FZW96_07365 [Bacillus sp. BGMRC 2118]|nr:hypothetical protein FZW96_07365 [Bacillus sp. BGMRC 2118]